MTTDELLAHLIAAACQGEPLPVLQAARELADQLSAGATPPTDPRS